MRINVENCVKIRSLSIIHTIFWSVPIQLYFDACVRAWVFVCGGEEETGVGNSIIMIEVVQLIGQAFGENRNRSYSKV